MSIFYAVPFGRPVRNSQYRHVFGKVHAHAPRCTMRFLEKQVIILTRNCFASRWSIFSTSELSHVLAPPLFTQSDLLSTDVLPLHTSLQRQYYRFCEHASLLAASGRSHPASPTRPEIFSLDRNNVREIRNIYILNVSTHSVVSPKIQLYLFTRAQHTLCYVSDISIRII